MKYLLFVTAFCFMGLVQADDHTVGDKVDNAGAAVKEAAQDTSKNTKQVYRDAKDKTCTMVNGKMECAGKKAKHKIQNAADEVKDKSNDLDKK